MDNFRSHHLRVSFDRACTVYHLLHLERRADERAAVCAIALVLGEGFRRRLRDGYSHRYSDELPVRHKLPTVRRGGWRTDRRPAGLRSEDGVLLRGRLPWCVAVRPRPSQRSDIRHLVSTRRLRCLAVGVLDLDRQRLDADPTGLRDGHPQRDGNRQTNRPVRRVLHPENALDVRPYDERVGDLGRTAGRRRLGVHRLEKARC